MRSSFPRASLACLILASLAQGCFLDATAFEAGASGSTSTGTGGDGLTGPTSAAGGAGGVGGSAGAGASVGTGAGGATSASGGAGGGTTTTTSTVTDCTIDAQCPDPPSICAGPKCDKGTCAIQNTNEGAACGVAMGECFDFAKCDKGDCISKPLPKGTALFSPLNDCKKRLCGDNGVVEENPDDADHQASDECMMRHCDGGQLVEEPQNNGEDCAFTIGKCCNGGCCLAAQGCCQNNTKCDFGGGVCL